MLKFEPPYSPKQISEIIYSKDLKEKCALKAQMLRINITEMIEIAGSGHLGTSLSVTDILVSLEYFLAQFDNSYYFSSKGHDAPAIYSQYISNNILESKFHGYLRKKDGLPGHPDISKENIRFNTGSLGMGISKAKGMILGRNLKGLDNDDPIAVILGDGELQEGQIWESMAVNEPKSISPLIAIADCNGIQSDTWTEITRNIGSLKLRCESYGWGFISLDGHNFEELFLAFNKAYSDKSKPYFIEAKTLKGKGIIFAESNKFDKSLEEYKYHSGALGRKDYLKALECFLNFNKKIGLAQPENNNLNNLKKLWDKREQKSNIQTFSLLQDYSNALLAVGSTNNKIIVLDADLAKDTGNLLFKRSYPSRHFEFGIAEQDMCSTASGLSEIGFYPWIHSFSCFLTTRAQEQIFNFATEKRNAVFVGCLSGITPGMPGHSHQMTRDLALMSSIPGMKVIEPATSLQLEDAVRLMSDKPGLYYLRISNNVGFKFPLNKEIKLPNQGDFFNINENKKSDKFIILSSMELLSQLAKTALLNNGKELNNIYLVNWHNIINDEDLLRLQNKKVLLMTNSHSIGSFVNKITNKLSKLNINLSSLKIVSVDEVPICGTNDEVLDFHGFSKRDISDFLFK